MKPCCTCEREAVIRSILGDQCQRCWDGDKLRAEYFHFLRFVAPSLYLKSAERQRNVERLKAA